MSYARLSSRLLQRSATVILAVAVGSLTSAAIAAAAPPEADAPQRAVPHQVLVGFKDGATAAQRERAAVRVNAQRRESVARANGGGADVDLLFLPSGASNGAAIDRLIGDPAIAYAEPNWRYRKSSHSRPQLEEPSYANGSLWGMYGDSTTPRNQFGSQAGEAWAAGRVGSDSVYVGVIDEGIQVHHPDLAGNIGQNLGEVPDDGLNNDSNGLSKDDSIGYVDDVHGWDFVNNDNTVYDAGQDSHGTHVAGTIGAEKNDTGVVGVNWHVKMLSGKFLGPNGGTTANAIRAVNYFTHLKSRSEKPVNVVATNNSWGGGGYSQGLHDAIIRGAKADILFVAAAGNDGANNDRRASYPANYDTTKGTSTETAATFDAVISVAAIASDGSRPKWSNYGAKTVDLGAPGVGILSTLPEGGYGSYSGTSMATPHVSGGAALYSSTRPGGTAAAIRNAIVSSALPTPSLNGKTVTGGRLDIGGF